LTVSWWDGTCHKVLLQQFGDVAVSDTQWAALHGRLEATDIFLHFC
jgi:hypothetical protein